VIRYREEDVVARVMDLTGGAGVEVAYDAVGKDTFDGSLAVLATRGHLVNYGQASGTIPPLDISRLGAKSLSLTRPFLWAYVGTREKLVAASAALFDAMASGALPLAIGGRFPLARAADAHAALEARGIEPYVLDC
jgi:NADPH:quinone reductase-like Zn-dependent oxidoreductase